MPSTEECNAPLQQPQGSSTVTASSITMHKASASKAFLENHYRGMLRGLKQQEGSSVGGAVVKDPNPTVLSELVNCNDVGRSSVSGGSSTNQVLPGTGTTTTTTTVETKQSRQMSGSFPLISTVGSEWSLGSGTATTTTTTTTTVVRPRKREIKASDFTLLKCIGRGAFGDVYICTKNSTSSLDSSNSDAMYSMSKNVLHGGRLLYAMKRMRKADMLKKKQVLHVRSERNVLAEAAQVNPYVVQLYYSFQDENYLYMVTEYAPGGDLMSWLISEQIFTVEQTRFYIAELCMAVKSVHEMNYVHRDIKPDNILIDIRGHAKLSDFGLCKKFELPSKKERHRWLEIQRERARRRAEKALQQGVIDGMPDDYALPLHQPVNIKGDIYTDIDVSSCDEVMINDSDNDGDAIHIPSLRQSGINNSKTSRYLKKGSMDTGGVGVHTDDVVDLYEELEEDEMNKRHLSDTLNTAASSQSQIVSNILSPNNPSEMHSRNMSDSRRFADISSDNCILATTIGTDELAKSTLREAIKRRQRFESIVGSPGYIAPEILLKQPYGINCDYWSVGVIMYEMLYGGPPFYAEDPQTTCSKIVNWRSTLKFPKPDGRHIPYVPPEAIDLMTHLMCDMDNRYDFNQIKVHPFFNGVDWDNLQAVEPVADMENHRRNSVSARGSQGLDVTGGGSNGVLVPFFPQLSHPLDTKYFPDMDNSHRLVDEQHMELMKAEDPRGVIFADFKFKRDE